MRPSNFDKVSEIRPASWIKIKLFHRYLSVVSNDNMKQYFVEYHQWLLLQPYVHDKTKPRSVSRSKDIFYFLRSMSFLQFLTLISASICQEQSLQHKLFISNVFSSSSFERKFFAFKLQLLNTKIYFSTCLSLQITIKSLFNSSFLKPSYELSRHTTFRLWSVLFSFQTIA